MYDQVEIFLIILARKLLKRGSFSTVDAVECITQHVEGSQQVEHQDGHGWTTASGTMPSRSASA